jgi:hypothetical protein
LRIVNDPLAGIIDEKRWPQQGVLPRGGMSQKRRLIPKSGNRFSDKIMRKN